MITFESWPKTPRLFRDMVITEKIDGTNAAVIIEPFVGEPEDSATIGVGSDGRYVVGAQSRNRLINPADDNYGFARWVFDNATALATILGPGRHFGEWWGSGIQRGYGQTGGEKRFSLFNVNRYDLSGSTHADFGLRVVPTLYAGPFSTYRVNAVLNDLEENGSHAAPGFMRPEGVVVYHTAAGQTFKALIENDDKPKGATS